MTINKKFKRATSIALLVLIGLVPKFVLTKCTQPTGGDRTSPTGTIFDEEGFRKWLGDQEREMRSGSGGGVVITSNFINRAADFARANWNPTYENTYETWRDLAERHANQFFSPDARPVTITKGGKTFNCANPLGSFMLDRGTLV